MRGNSNSKTTMNKKIRLDKRKLVKNRLTRANISLLAF